MTSSALSADKVAMAGYAFGKPALQGLAMRFGFILLAALVGLVSSPARAYVMPYDPYPWCAVYAGRGGGGTNCGFLTIEQCRATVSGIGGFCAPNQFYNPRPAARARKKQAN